MLFRDKRDKTGGFGALLQPAQRHRGSSDLLEEIEKSQKIREVSQWMLELELSWRGGIRGSSSGVGSFVQDIEDPYLDLIDKEELVRIHHNSAFTKYQLLVWLKDNLPDLQALARSACSRQKQSNKVFMYWNSGWDSPPLVVDLVKNRTKQLLPKGRELILLDDGNYQTYIEGLDIPRNLEALKEKSMAHFSDWLRVALLKKHGGLWVDASAFAMPRLFEICRDVDSLGDCVWAQRSVSNHQISNWLLYAGLSENYAISLMYYAISLWLEEHGEFLEYFFFHAVWYFLSQIDAEFSRQWEETYYLESKQGFQLWKNHDDSISEAEFESLLQSHPCHKLNVRYTAGVGVKADSAVGRLQSLVETVL